MDPVSIVILSGGKSSRMGQDKANLTIDGVTFVQRLKEALPVEGDEILFSVKNSGDFPNVDLAHISDVFPGCGPMSGIHSAIIHACHPWIFVVACDMPYVNRMILEDLHSICREDTQAVIPISEDGRLQVLCGLYHKSCFPVFEAMLKEGNYRMRDALKQLNVTYVPVSSLQDGEKKIRNVNTMEDYQNILKDN